MNATRAAGLPEPPADLQMAVPPTPQHRMLLKALQLSVDDHPDPARANEALFKQEIGRAHV